MSANSNEQTDNEQFSAPHQNQQKPCEIAFTEATRGASYRASQLHRITNVGGAADDRLSVGDGWRDRKRFQRKFHRDSHRLSSRTDLRVLTRWSREPRRGCFV